MHRLRAVSNVHILLLLPFAVFLVVARLLQRTSLLKRAPQTEQNRIGGRSLAGSGVGRRGVGGRGRGVRVLGGAGVADLGADAAGADELFEALGVAGAGLADAAAGDVETALGGHQEGHGEEPEPAEPAPRGSPRR